MDVEKIEHIDLNVYKENEQGERIGDTKRRVGVDSDQQKTEEKDELEWI